MLLCKKDIQAGIDYYLIPFLKQYDIDINQYHILLNDHIALNGQMTYQGQKLCFQVCFDPDYQNEHVCLKNVEGIVEYKFLKINILNLLSQLIKDERFFVNKQSCFYHIDLPIQYVSLNNQQLLIEFKSS